MCHTWGALGGALGGALPLDCHSLVYPPAYAGRGRGTPRIRGVCRILLEYGSALE